MAWLEAFAVAVATVAEVSFMPRSLPVGFGLQNISLSKKKKKEETTPTKTTHRG